MGRLLLVHFLLVPAVGSAVHNCSLLEREVRVALDDHVVSYPLPDSFILLSSETVVVTDSSLDTSQYTMDYNGGIIELREPVGGQMEVRYRVFPFPLSAEYCHRRKMIDSTVQSVVERADRTARRTAPEEGLRIGGSKTFSIGIGSKEEVDLNQSLQLQLGGELSGVAVSGVLSDKNTSLNEGGTKSVDELDDVYMEVEGDRFKCRIGAYDLEIDGNRFCRLERKLDGVMGRVSIGGIDAEAAGAATRTKFRSDAFSGEDGKQGPYQLRGSNGRECFNLVARTERVYLDGELLERGHEKDYVIDYELGVLEFTPRRLITSESRIAVDFQHSDDEFKRKVYSASVAVGMPSQNLNVTASLYTERDCPESSPHSSLSARAAEGLGADRSDTGDVWVDGGELVGEGRGDYLRDGDHYEYVGKDLGDYRVSFTHVGDSKGDYRYDDETGGYHWVEHGFGDYLARIRVSAPQNRSLYDVKLTYDPTEQLHIDYEQAWMTRDLNTLSAIDAARRSEAHALELVLKERPVGWGKLTLSTGIWKAGREFGLPSEVVAKEKEKWGEQIDLRGSEAEEVAAVYSVPAAEMALSIGRMQSHDGDILRKEATTTLNPHGTCHAFVNYQSVVQERSSTVRFRTRRTVGLTHQLWHFTPSFTYTDEVEKEERAKEYALLLGLMRVGCLSGSYEGQMVFTDTKESGSIWKSEAKERRDILRVRMESSRTSAECNYTHRRKDYRTSMAPRLDYSLFSLAITSIPVKERLDFGLTSSFTSRRSQKREVLYTKVKEGEGDYVRDPLSGEYYLCESGDYTREYVWTGSSEPSLGLTFDVHSRLQPTGAAVLSSRFSTEREATNRDVLFSIWGGESLRNLFENRLEIFGPTRRIALRLDHRLSLTRNPWGQEDVGERRSVGFRAAGERMELIVAATEEISESGTASYIRVEDRKRRLEGTEILKLRPFTFSLLQGIEMKRIRFPHHYNDLGWIDVNSVFVGPFFRYDVRTKYSLEGRGKLTYSTLGDDSPYILAVTNPPGWVYEWGAVLNCWMNQSVSSTFIYEGKKRRGIADHQLRAEIRGYF